MRLIDADALKLSLMTVRSDELVRYCYPCEKVLKKIDEQPTIEERKVGKWNRRKGMYEVGFKCSECNSFSIAETPYCSFCGARMVQEGAEHETDRR